MFVEEVLMERRTAFRIAAHLANGDKDKFMRMVKVCIVSSEVLAKHKITGPISELIFENRLLNAERQFAIMEDLKRREKAGGEMLVK